VCDRVIRDLLIEFHEKLRDSMRPGLFDIPTHEREVWFAILDGDVRAAVQSFKQRLRRYRSKVKEQQQSLQYTELEQACCVLGITTPKWGLPIDSQLIKAKACELVHKYHPDTGNGDAEAYNAVITAKRIVKQYQEVLKHQKSQERP